MRMPPVVASGAWLETADTAMTGTVSVAVTALPAGAGVRAGPLTTRRAVGGALAITAALAAGLAHRASFSGVASLWIVPVNSGAGCLLACPAEAHLISSQV